MLLKANRSLFLLSGLLLLQMFASSCGTLCNSGPCKLSSGGTSGSGNSPTPVAFLYTASSQIFPAVLSSDNSFQILQSSILPIPGGSGARNLTVIAKNYLYLMDLLGNIDAYIINRQTGAVTQIAGTFPAFPAGAFFAADPLGRFLFVASNNSLTVLSINPTNGSLTAVGQPTPLPIGTSSSMGLAVDPQGKVLIITNGTSGDSFTISQTGGLQLTSSTPFLTPMRSFAFDLQSKFLYGVDGTSPSIYGFSVLPGGTLGASLPGLPLQTTFANRVALFNPKAPFLYIGEDNNIIGFVENTTSGALSVIQQPAFSTAVNGNQLAIDQSGSFLFSNGNVLSVMRINQVTGVLGLDPNQLSSSAFINAPITATD